jgi:glycosyltransferase 2 family protein
MTAVLASIADSIGSFLDAVEAFWSNLAAVDWIVLLLGLAAFVIYQSIRARAAFNIQRAAYPTEHIQFRYIWGAYMAGYGFNSVIPARSGDIVRLFLTKNSVPNSTYPAVASGMAVELIFDAVMAVLILTFAFSQGVFPKPPDFSDVAAFDLAWFAQNPQFTIFLITFLLVVALVVIALLSARIQAFWSRVRQGLTILRDRRRYLREVFAVQFAGWCFRFTAFWLLLEAFHVGGSVRNVLLVLGVNAVGALVPITPQGAGVQQALFVQVFAGVAATATIAAYSVGQQIAIASTMFAIGFASIFFLFGFRSWRDIIDRGKAERSAAKAAAKAG